MKTILNELGRSIVATLFFAVILCCLYPLVVYGLAQWLFPNHANGSLLVDKTDAIRGSALIAQNFTGPQYFHPRPSAASAGDPTSAVSANNYDATHSSGSNLGPTSSNLVSEITQRVAAYRAENGMSTDATVPADAVTASGSGLDPDISPQNAALQIPRVAKARGMSEKQLSKLVHQNTEGRDLGIWGEPRVNVMTLNFALDHLSQK